MYHSINRSSDELGITNVIGMVKSAKRFSWNDPGALFASINCRQLMCRI